MKKKIILGLVILFLSGLMFLFFSFLFSPSVYISKPNYVEIKNSNNEKLDTFINNYHGEYVKLNEVSNEFINTLISTEDKNFFSHHGFDYKRIIKSLIDNLKSNSLSQGASTISQQLIKNLYLTNEQTWDRKLHEAFLTIKLEQNYSKEEILETYINNVYFAHNIYGLKSASNYYFHKEPHELNYQESCLLVGVINAPNLYSPFIDLKASNEKQKNIAYNLFLNSVITAQEYYSILVNKSPLFGSFINYNYDNYHYYQGVYKELIKTKINSKESGLIIETYLQEDVQNIINKTIKKFRKSRYIS